MSNNLWEFMVKLTHLRIFATLKGRHFENSLLSNEVDLDLCIINCYAKLHCPSNKRFITS